MTVLEITNYGRNTLRRLRLEARILDAAVQPRLAPAYELDRCAPTATLVTELLPDVTLDDLVSISPLPAAAALHALRDVAGTLHAMHECDLVHGDLRPSGVLILPDGRAALARPDAAPAAQGTSHTSAVQADSFGFAVLAFELLTGVHPLDPTDGVAMAGALGVLPPRAATALRRALTAPPARRPRPLDLVETLDAVPAERWSSNQLRPAPVHPLAPPLTVGADAAAEVEAPAEAGRVVVDDPAPVPEVVVAAAAGPPPAPTEVAPSLPGPQAAVRTAPPRPRRSRWRRILSVFTILVGLVTVLAGGGAGAWLLFAPASTVGDPAPPPVQVHRVALSITPPQANCPQAAMHLAATIVTDGGEGMLEVRWRLPDGTLASSQSLMAESGDRLLHTSFDLRLEGRRQVLGPVVATVTPGDARATVPLRYLCADPGRHHRRSRSI